MVKTTVDYIEGMIEKYGDRYPRRTTLAEIEAVDKRAVARQNLRLSYDKKSSFYGTEVRGDQFKLTVSEFEHVLAIAKDGTYRVMSAPEKVFFTGPMIYAEIFDPDEGVEFTVVYRDKKRIAYAKKIKIEKFIRNREYRLIKDKGGRVDLLLPPGESGTIHMDFVPAKRQRVKTADFDLESLELTSAGARGARMAPKPVAKVKLIPAEKTAAAPKKKTAAPKSSASKSTKKSGPKSGQGDLF